MSAVRKLAVIGDGQMGNAVAELARANGWEVVATIGMEGNENGNGITRESLHGAQVAIEFTEPAAAVANVSACLRAECPVVVGTTGWHDALPAMEKLARESNSALLWSSNFSTGVNIFLEIVRRAGELLKESPGFEPRIKETHHTRKKDAPSGTAIAIERAARETLGREIPIDSVREGDVVGTHELTFDSDFEQIALTHTAHDRRVFAEGALRAAAWLIGKKGVFTMNDVLGLRSAK
ncbi:MAG: 4-hydroxy-tetrahydrodipicolinate reductase [Gemmatimonadota bacterium]|nr:4-hydroxy-tetrahydrodipicolinate reductase [Gemmatimonadota bacterium]